MFFFKKSLLLLLIFLLAIPTISFGLENAELNCISFSEVKVELQNSHVKIVNNTVCIDYNLETGTYDVYDKLIRNVCMEKVGYNLNFYKSTNPKYQHSWSKKPVKDALGKGQTLRIESKATSLPDLVIDFTVYEGQPFFVLSAGLRNTTSNIVYLTRIEPLASELVFDGKNTLENFSILDGNGGSNDTFVVHKANVHCRNNALVTFGKGERRRSIVMGGLTYYDYSKFVKVDRNKSYPKTLSARIYASDPIGKRVDPGFLYIPKDKFYIDFVTQNFFESLENYARNLKKAQDIELSMYDFPTICMWFAETPLYGDGPSQNTTAGAVEEAQIIADSGFLEYSRAAVRLVPDSYYLNNQQGWWDNEHYQNPVEPHNGTANGVYVKPYETNKKWGQKVTELGVLPLTYMQTGLRSEDYALQNPGHMLFNRPIWKNPKLQLDADIALLEAHPWRCAMTRNENVWGYDYTDEGFIRHLQEDVYASMREGGIKGVMYDYPISGWAESGGLEDDYATAGSAYRNIFDIARDGLGHDCYLHERNVFYGSDISFGLVASQRIWPDTDATNPVMVTRTGLRWYKNRVVCNYDMDGKSLHKTTPSNRDGVRAMLTMGYVASGRLLIATSFGKMNEEMLYDITRIYPFHTAAQTARPIDAFVNEYPMIYDFQVNPDWHQVTLYNPTPQEETKVSFNMSGDITEGDLELDPKASYYIYNFWEDKLVGIFKGTDEITQTLRPGECRMLSIRKVQDAPQIVSTNRHIMQGYIDLEDVIWNEKTKTLNGKAKVVKDDPFKIVFALNGFKVRDASIGKLKIKDKSFAEIVIVSKQTQTVDWEVEFKK